MKIYLLVIILTFFANTLSLSMNNKLIKSSPSPLTIAYAKKTLALQKNLFHDPELTTDKIKIIFPDYQKLIIEKEAANKFDFFRGALEFDSNKLNKRIIKLPKNVPACLTKQNVELIIRQDRDSIPKEAVVAVFNAAEFLCAKEKLFYPIAEAYVTKFQESDYGPEYQEIKRFLGIKHFYTCNKKLENDSWGGNGLVSGGAVLSSRAKIHSLDDIDYLKKLPSFNKDYQDSIKVLRLPSHNITDLSVSKILKIFPNLSYLDLSCNKIGTLKINDLANLPQNFTLNLQNNPITSIQKKSSSKYPEFCTIYLSKCSNKKLNLQLESIAQELSPEHLYWRSSHTLARISAFVATAMFFSRFITHKDCINLEMEKKASFFGSTIVYTASLTSLFYLFKFATTKNTNKVLIYNQPTMILFHS